MAICIPETNKNFETPGERKFFLLLKNLPDSCLVYYEMVIGERDRRPDFVVIDKNKGITIFEVKDYGVDTILEATPKWFRIAASQNRTQNQKNPDYKVKQYIEDLREQLSTQETLCDTRDRLKIEIFHFLVFTTMSKSEFIDASLSEVVKTTNILFKEDIKNPESFIKVYNQYEDKKITSPLSSHQLNAIRNSLFPELLIPGGEQWFSSKSKGPIISINKSNYEFGLDLQQEQMAKSLGSGPRFLHGIAGTGKTLILLFHAKLMSANAYHSKRTPRILVLCWNISLAQYMRHAYKAIQIPDAVDIDIMHFSAFARKIMRNSPGLNFPKLKDLDFDEKLTDVLNNVYVNENQKYDIVYIDEAQDFQKDWIKFIFDKLLEGSADERNLVIAGDYAQQIYRYRNFARSSGFTWKSIGIPMTGRGKAITLKKIYRNSARVWSYAAAFLGDINKYYEDKETKISFAPKKGIDPRLIECKSIDEQLDKAVDYVSRLAEYGYSPRNAMVLYRWSTYKGIPIIAKLIDKFQERKIPYQWITEDNEKKATFEWGEESVKISTIHSAKGMDAPVVIILAAEAFKSKEEEDDNEGQDETKLMYVGLTRARELLVILHTGDNGMVPNLKTAMASYHKWKETIERLEAKANKEITN
ncbi:MAG: AAA family ATPase [Anaerolineae bacterium]|nr:AAA family ATPase [Anaerolineae bacterium]